MKFVESFERSTHWTNGNSTRWKFQGELIFEQEMCEGSKAGIDAASF